MNIKDYIILFFIIVLIVLAVLFSNKKTDVSNYNFSIYFFNAGKADAILINNNDKYVMIDTGEEDLSDEILSYFRLNNITSLEYLIITHFDKDHVGSASSVIDNIDVKNVLVSNYPKESEYYSNFISSLNNKNIDANIINSEYSFSIDDMSFIVNGPNKIYDKNESNNSSLIVELTYKNNSFLFMGDAQNNRINDYVSSNKKVFDFIKMPYHGIYQKRLSELLNSTKPKYAVITNSMVEDKTISLLDGLSINYYVTYNGPIYVYSDGNSIKIIQ